jgi:N-methylhydantoinase B/oxoprolinase/acetone carboxylase alpha subunit
MGHALTRNAISPIFIEGQDFSCAILDSKRELVAAANFDPSHLCSMPYSVDWAVLELGQDAIGPTDVVISNDPYRGGTHLPDVTMFSPVFIQSRLIGYAVTRAHHLDIGGMSPGSIPGGARDVFAEGLRIPPLKWAAHGDENQEVINFILSNVRLPEVELSDLRAQVASLLVGVERIQSLCDRYGVASVLGAMDGIKDISEEQMRQFIRVIPDGSYKFVDYMDGDGNTDFRYALHVTLDVRGDAVKIDFNGTSKQAEGAINLPFAMTASSVYNAFLQLAGRDIPFNHGCFRPIGFHAPRGTMVNAQPPAPTFGCTTDTPLRVIDAVVGALAGAIPDRVIAGSYGTCNCVAGAGSTAEGEPFLYWFFYEGGYGASASRDGWNATPNQSANFRDYPVEIIERTYPLRCDAVGLLPDSGGPGEHRGGLGTVHEFTFLAPTLLSGFGDRHKIRPYGLEGGLPGQGNRFLFRRAGSDRWLGIEELAGHPSKFSGFVAAKGDSIRILTGGGGGFGDPSRRDPRAVERDLAEGLTTTWPGPAAEHVGADPQVLDAFSAVESLGRVRPTAAADDLSERVRGVFASIGEETCRSACPLQADAQRCPYHHAEALLFWPRWILQRWTDSHCMLSRDLVPALRPADDSHEAAEDV